MFRNVFLIFKRLFDNFWKDFETCSPCLRDSNVFMAFFLKRKADVTTAGVLGSSRALF